jgi:hypothetical protein
MPYCRTCGEYLGCDPLDADAMVMLIHALAGHDVELKERVAC